MKIVQFIVIILAIVTIFAGMTTITARPIEPASILCATIDCSTYTLCGTKCKNPMNQLVFVLGPDKCPGQTPYWCSSK